ncbi:MAG: D-2-hydroxyacid dehydrogenase [Armatimonadota bacterium]
MSKLSDLHILVPASLYEELVPAVVALVPEAHLTPYDEDPALAPPHADEAEIVLRWVAGKRYGALVANGPKVRWLHTASAGVDHVLTPEVKAKPGLVLTDSGPAFAIAMGEFVLTWMLMVSHRMPEMLAQQQSRTWKWITQEELHGQTVGVIGLGPIGQGIASRCKAFGMKTMGFRRRNEPVPDVDETLTGTEGLDRLLRESDWVVIAAALTGDTRSLLGAKEIARMKPTARLINIARGGLIDESALIDALRSGAIAGACLDVFAQEPLPTDNPLWDMPNVLISPHTSPGWTTGLRERQKEIFLSNLQKYVRGEEMAGVVDIDRGY